MGDKIAFSFVLAFLFLSIGSFAFFHESVFFHSNPGLPQTQFKHNRYEFSRYSVKKRNEEPERIQHTQINKQKGRVGKAAFSGLLSVFTFALGPSIPLAIKEARNGAPVGEAVTSALRKQTMASASILKKFTKRTLSEKLANVPVFVVTNAAGQPYLVPTMGPEKQDMSAGLFFFDPEDAETMMMEMLQSSGGRPDARVFAMNLEKAASMAFQAPRDLAEGQSIGFQFFQNAEQLSACTQFQEADGTVRKQKKGEEPPALVVRAGNIQQHDIPVFFVPGLTLKKDRINVKPLFFSIEDAKEVWDLAKKRDKNNEMPTTCNAQALNLFDVIIDMQQNEEEWKEYGFFPMKKAMDYVKNVKRRGSSQARLHRKLR